MAIMACIRIHPNKEMTVDEFKAWIGQFDMDHDSRISREELYTACINGSGGGRLDKQ